MISVRKAPKLCNVSFKMLFVRAGSELESENSIDNLTFL